MKFIVVAYDLNRGIGANNDLLWQRDLPADLKHFKDLTLNKTVIMGRKTYESIGRPLPKRQNIVLSRSKIDDARIEVAHSLKEAYSLIEAKDTAIIGGESLFIESLNDVDTVYATEVKAEFPEATVFFPELDTDVWQEVNRQPNQSDDKNLYDYDFVTYRRITG